MLPTAFFTANSRVKFWLISAAEHKCEWLTRLKKKKCLCFARHRCYSLLPEQLQVAFLHKTCVPLTYLTGEGARSGLALENPNKDCFSTQLSLRGTWVLRACCLCWVLSAGEHWGCSLPSVVRTVSHWEGSRCSFPPSLTKSLLHCRMSIPTGPRTHFFFMLM